MEKSKDAIIYKNIMIWESLIGPHRRLTDIQNYVASHLEKNF